MPILGSGLSIGTISKIPGYDLDASAYITSNNISSSATIPILGTDNIIVSSFSDSYYYNISLCSIVPSSLANPFGTANDAVLLRGVNLTYGRILRTSADFILPNTSYVISCYAKAGATNYFGIRLTSGMISGNTYVTFNLSNGTYASITPGSGTINNVGMDSIGNGWYRCYAKYTTGASIVSNLCDFAVVTSSGDTQANSSNSENVYIWGPMVEQTSNSTPSQLTWRSGYGSGGDNASILMSNGSMVYETINPRSLINQFVVGMKSFNLWYNFICWPMRSIFNVGSGTSVSAFGSSIAYPATMTNSPSWATYGIRTTATNKYIGSVAVGSNFLDLGNGTYSLFSVFKQFEKTDYFYLNMQSSQASGPGYRIGPHSTIPNLTFYGNTSGSSPIAINSNINNTGFNSFNVIKTGTSSIDCSMNNGAFQTTNISSVPTTGSSATAGLDFGNASSYVGTGYRVFEAIHTTNAIAQNSASSMYDLFKTTLGYGLNLP